VEGVTHFNELSVVCLGMLDAPMNTMLQGAIMALTDMGNIVIDLPIFRAKRNYMLTRKDTRWSKK
jgi:hypothetical protein